jgi:hypothetical protein
LDLVPSGDVELGPCTRSAECGSGKNPGVGVEGYAPLIGQDKGSCFAPSFSLSDMIQTVRAIIKEVVIAEHGAAGGVMSSRKCGRSCVGHGG